MVCSWSHGGPHRAQAPASRGEAAASVADGWAGRSRGDVGAMHGEDVKGWMGIRRPAESARSSMRGGSDAGVSWTGP
jgi:hypothetical protein